ncbi:MAG: hypothetical protein JO272_00020 [Pseudonocardiales bacterium]|nr:hypothetical protein [Pseudonocardiales bacterium]
MNTVAEQINLYCCFRKNSKTPRNGKDSTPTNSPTLYATDEDSYIVAVTPGGHYIIQGRRVTDAQTLSQMSIPEHETCVHVQKSAMLTLVGG